MSDVGLQGRRLASPALRRFVLIALAGLACLPCSAALGATQRLFDGNPVAVPGYMAYLQAANANGTWTCGAAAIGRNVVLTAAHCVIDEVTNRFMNSADLSLVFGQDDPERALADGTASVVHVVRYLVPSGYGIYDNGVATDDVAVLQTAEPVPGVISLLPPDRSDLLRIGASTLVLGWGLTDASDEQSAPTTLLSASMPVRRSSVCSREVAHFNDRLMICAGDGQGAAPCPGDSGGPMIVSDPATGTQYEAGLVSFGQDCQLVGSISAFARVSGSELYGFVTDAAQRLQDAADGTAPTVLASADSSAPPAPKLTFARARSAAAAYARKSWHWKVTRISCARQSQDGIVCRVNGKRRGRPYFSRMLVMLDRRGRTSISDAG